MIIEQQQYYQLANSKKILLKSTANTIRNYGKLKSNRLHVYMSNNLYDSSITQLCLLLSSCSNSSLMSRKSL